MFYLLGFPGGSDGKESACSTGDLGSISGSGNPLDKRMATHSLQYSCLENSMDRGACSLQITKNWTWLSDRTTITRDLFKWSDHWTPSSLFYMAVNDHGSEWHQLTASEKQQQHCRRTSQVGTNSTSILLFFLLTDL